MEDTYLKLLYYKNQVFLKILRNVPFFLIFFRVLDLNKEINLKKKNQ